MESIPEILVQNGGLLGLVGAIALAVIGMIIRAKGPALFAAKPSLPDPSPQLRRIDKEVQEISVDVSEIAHRVESIEQDLKQRPTRLELHHVDKGIVRLEERFKAIQDVVGKTSEGVRRIDDFLLSLAKDRS